MKRLITNDDVAGSIQLKKHRKKSERLLFYFCSVILQYGIIFFFSIKE